MSSPWFRELDGIIPNIMVPAKGCPIKAGGGGEGCMASCVRGTSPQTTPS